jgi:cystathionine beta-lyase/cystathionine gamma-synthase
MHTLKGLLSASVVPDSLSKLFMLHITAAYCVVATAVKQIHIRVLSYQSKSQIGCLISCECISFSLERNIQTVDIHIIQ